MNCRGRPLFRAHISLLLLGCRGNEASGPRSSFDFSHFASPKNENIVEHPVPLGPAAHLKPCSLKIPSEGFSTKQERMITMAKSPPGCSAQAIRWATKLRGSDSNHTTVPKYSIRLCKHHHRAVHVLNGGVHHNDIEGLWLNPGVLKRRFDYRNSHTSCSRCGNWRPLYSHAIVKLTCQRQQLSRTTTDLQESPGRSYFLSVFE